MKAFLGIPEIMGGKTALHFLEKPMKMSITEEQQQLLQRTALTDGTNAWEWVMQQRKEDQPWAAAGVLSCIEKDYELNEAMICWEARELR